MVCFLSIFFNAHTTSFRKARWICLLTYTRVWNQWMAHQTDQEGSELVFKLWHLVCSYRVWTSHWKVNVLFSRVEIKIRLLNECGTLFLDGWDVFNIWRDTQWAFADSLGVSKADWETLGLTILILRQMASWPLCQGTPRVRVLLTGSLFQTWKISKIDS